MIISYTGCTGYRLSVTETLFAISYICITKLRKFIAESDSGKKLKSVNIWHSYKQERDCLVHFLRLLAVC